MKKFLVLTSIFCGALSLQAEANPLVKLIIGRLGSSNNVVSQVIGVENKTQSFVGNVRVECGFYSGDQLVAFGFTFIENLPPEAEGQGIVSVTSGENITSTKCRVVSPQ